MHFDLVDAVIERSPERIVALKNVSAAEEYLQDHFPTFPVLPGVLMLEAMVQTARRWLAHHHPDADRHVLGSVRALKYGSFVRPGDTMRITVAPSKPAEEGRFEFKGSAEVLRPAAEGPPPTCVSGRFTLRPIRAAVGPT
jgi:3-hydroxyacyl-[acyl-carrier-protein] dehydratase